MEIPIHAHSSEVILTPDGEGVISDDRRAYAVAIRDEWWDDIPTKYKVEIQPEAAALQRQAAALRKQIYNLLEGI